MGMYTFTDKVNLLLGLVFLVGILFISYSFFWGIVPLFLMMIFIYLKKGNRKLIATFSAFLIGFILYRATALLLTQLLDGDEARILLNRFLLLFIILCLMINSRYFKHRFHYLHKPNWHATIYFPFIWSGFHSLQIKYFLIMAMLINSVVFIPFIIKHDFNTLKGLLLFAIGFSIINAILEEIIWRGYLLSQLKDSVDDYFALIITSIGFGLQHISIGIPLIPSILFSFGGIFFAGIVMRSNSIIPSIIWHFLINLGMVFSGFIFSI